MNSELFEIESRESFPATLIRLENAITSQGLSVFARIDHAAAAKSAGLSMPPTIVLLYGNPMGGTPIMLACPRAALDLPLRVLIRERNGRVLVAFHPVSGMLTEAGVPADLAGRLEPAQDILVRALEQSV